MPSASDKSQLLSVLEAREDLRDIRGAEVAFQGLGEDVAEVGRDCQIAALVELLAIETGPFAVDLAAFDVAAKDEHRVAVPVIRSAIAVLAHGASELRHRDEHHVLHAIAEVAGERRDAAGELVQTIRDLS